MSMLYKKKRDRVISLVGSLGPTFLAMLSIYSLSMNGATAQNLFDEQESAENPSQWRDRGKTQRMIDVKLCNQKCDVILKENSARVFATVCANAKTRYVNGRPMTPVSPACNDAIDVLTRDTMQCTDVCIKTYLK